MTLVLGDRYVSDIVLFRPISTRRCLTWAVMFPTRRKRKRICTRVQTWVPDPSVLNLMCNSKLLDMDKQTLRLASILFEGEN